MSTSPKKSDRSKSKQKQKKDKLVKPPKDKDTKSKKSKDPEKASHKSSPVQKETARLPTEVKYISELKPALPVTVESNEHICHYHREITFSFCETCEQLCCPKCVSYGPHQSQVHRIVGVEQCYRNRYLYLKELIFTDLLKRRDQLSQRIQKLNGVMDELKYNKQIIQKDIKQEFDGVLERLKVAYGGKLAVLYNAMAELQRQLENLNAVGKEFFNLTNLSSNESAETNPKGLIPFLLRSRQLQEQAENLIAFPIHETVNINPYDIPRQTHQRKELLLKAVQSDPTREFKHQVICSLVVQSQQTNTSLQSQFHDQANFQRTEWVKITQQLRSQLAKFDKICHFCGAPLSIDSVNTQCFRNLNRVDDSGYCLKPPPDAINNRFHYFSTPV